MRTNIGNIDRVFKLVIAASVVVPALFKVVTGMLGFILLIAAAILAVTSISGICPLYSLLSTNTRRKQP